MYSRLRNTRNRILRRINVKAQKCLKKPKGKGKKRSILAAIEKRRSSIIFPRPPVNYFGSRSNSPISPVTSQHESKFCIGNDKQGPVTSTPVLERKQGLHHANSNGIKKISTSNRNERESADRSLTFSDDIIPIQLANKTISSLMAQKDESESLQSLPEPDIPGCSIIELTDVEYLDVAIPMRNRPNPAYVDNENIPICIILELNDVF